MDSFSLGLVGFPLTYSYSQMIHQAALKETGLGGEYRLYPIPPDPAGIEVLTKLLYQFRAGSLQGLNVTIPHKQKVIPFLDNLSATARSIGAVNTLYLRDSQLFGENTDMAGFVQDVQETLGLSLDDPMHALVLGAGGAARSIVFALAQRGWSVQIVARRFEQAKDLAENLAARIRSINPQANPQLTAGKLDLLELEMIKRQAPIDLIVNTTPVGTANVNPGAVWPGRLALPENCRVYDLVYNPQETPLIRQAQKQGIPAANGVGMLVEQAAIAFELWTQHPAPRKAMRESIPAPR